MPWARWVIVALAGLLVPMAQPARERIETADVVVDFPAGFHSYARLAARLYVASRDDLSARLDVPFEKPARVSLYEDDSEFEARVSGHRLEQWVAAVAIPSTNEIVVRGSSPDARSEAGFAPLLRHEVCHLLVAEAEAEGGERIPLWFNEGLAQWAADRLVVEAQDVALLDRYGFLLSFRQVADAFPVTESEARIAYVQSESIVRFIIHRLGLEAIRETLRGVRRSVPFDDALRSGTRAELYELEREWKQWLRDEFSLPYLIVRSLPFFAIVALVVVAAFVVRRIRDRRLLRAMEEADRAEPAPYKTPAEPHEPDAL